MTEAIVSRILEHIKFVNQGTAVYMILFVENIETEGKIKGLQYQNQCP